MTQAPQRREVGTHALEPADIEAIQMWIKKEGEPLVLDEVGVSRLALARCAGGLGVHAGTRLAVRSALARRGK
jgi:hypothetical protein